MNNEASQDQCSIGLAEAPGVSENVVDRWDGVAFLSDGSLRELARVEDVS